MSPESFEAVSKRAEAWIHTVYMVGQLGERGSVESAYELLDFLNQEYSQHSHSLRAALPQLRAHSDQQIMWPEDRGYSAAYRGGTVSCWSSAHEAADGIARIALDLLMHPLAGIDDLQEQRGAAEQLLSDRWKAVAIPKTEVASLQERIRRERVKLLNQPPNEDAWSEAKAPSDWQKELSISATTWRRYIDEGKLIVDRISTKRVRIRTDTLRALIGSK